MQEAGRGELDMGVLAALSDGESLPADPSRRIVRPSRAGVLATIGPWLVSRSSLAAAAAVAIVAGSFYLASMSPNKRVLPERTTAQSARDANLPSWAVLPERAAVPPRAAEASQAAAAPMPEAIAAITSTTDAELAVAWLREGRLAVRLTTDAPRRDGAKLTGMLAQANPASAWSLRTTDGRDSEVPSKPWPIDTRMADADGRSSLTRRESARLGAFTLAVRPTAESLVIAKESLERATRGGVVFERIDSLASEGLHFEDAPPSAAGLLWWTKPAEHWARRVRVPLVVEFGAPGLK